MSGHSKWSKIKHKKGAADASRGKLFAKLAKEIYVAAKSGEPDPDNNATLRLAVEKAKSQSMPKDNIQRAIDRAKGSQGGENFEEIIYEGYGPNGVAVMVHCLTDNRNRTASFVKSTFPRKGGNLGSDGSVSYLFDRKGVISIESDKLKMDKEEFELSILDFDVEDINEEEGVISIYTKPENFMTVKNQLDDLDAAEEFLQSEVTLIPSMYIELDESDQAKVEGLIDELEDNDDVQEVYHNMK